MNIEFIFFCFSWYCVRSMLEGNLSFTIWTYKILFTAVVIFVLNSIFTGFILMKMKKKAQVVVKLLAGVLIADDIIFCGYVTLIASGHLEDKGMKPLLQVSVFLWFLFKAIILIIGGLR